MAKRVKVCQSKSPVQAIQDLGEIVRYISFDNPQGAERFGYALIDAALSLKNLPERGRFVPEFDDGVAREILHRYYTLLLTPFLYSSPREPFAIYRFAVSERLFGPLLMP